MRNQVPKMYESTTQWKTTSRSYGSFHNSSSSRQYGSPPSNLGTSPSRRFLPAVPTSTASRAAARAASLSRVSSIKSMVAKGKDQSKEWPLSNENVFGGDKKEVVDKSLGLGERLKTHTCDDLNFNNNSSNTYGSNSMNSNRSNNRNPRINMKGNSSNMRAQSERRTALTAAMAKDKRNALAASRASRGAIRQSKDYTDAIEQPKDFCDRQADNSKMLGWTQASTRRLGHEGRVGISGGRQQTSQTTENRTSISAQVESVKQIGGPWRETAVTTEKVASTTATKPVASRIGTAKGSISPRQLPQRTARIDALKTGGIARSSFVKGTSSSTRPLPVGSTSHSSSQDAARARRIETTSSPSSKPSSILRADHSIKPTVGSYGSSTSGLGATRYAATRPYETNGILTSNGTAGDSVSTLTSSSSSSSLTRTRSFGDLTEKFNGKLRINDDDDDDDDYRPNGNSSLHRESNDASNISNNSSIGRDGSSKRLVENGISLSTSRSSPLRERSIGRNSPSSSTQEESNSPSLKSHPLNDCGLKGLRNLGNTCFMNSVLQCLSNTRALLEFSLNDKYSSDINKSTSSMKGQLISAFARLLQDLWKSSSDGCVSPSSFKSAVAKFAPRFTGYAQQDAQEFLRYLLQGLAEDVNRVTSKPKPVIVNDDEEDKLPDLEKAANSWKRYLRYEDSRIGEIFVGQLKSTLKCTTCGWTSTTFDPFWDLSLPLPKAFASRGSDGGNSIHSCLALFTKEEILDGDERPKCGQCKQRRKCTKSFTIQRFPRVLVLHLKRFSGGTGSFRGAKLSTLIDFPHALDLSDFASDSKALTARPRYNLYAVSNHSGSTHSGHYTAYCRHPYSGGWYYYNDSRVTKHSKGSVCSAEGYVLFYEHCSGGT